MKWIELSAGDPGKVSIPIAHALKHLNASYFDSSPYIPATGSLGQNQEVWGLSPATYPGRQGSDFGPIFFTRVKTIHTHLHMTASFPFLLLLTLRGQGCGIGSRVVFVVFAMGLAHSRASAML